MGQTQVGHEVLKKQLLGSTWAWGRFLSNRPQFNSWSGRRRGRRMGGWRRAWMTPWAGTWSRCHAASPLPPWTCCECDLGVCPGLPRWMLTSAHGAWVLHPLKHVYNIFNSVSALSQHTGHGNSIHRSTCTT